MTVRHLAVPAYTVPAAVGTVAYRSSSSTTYASRTTTTITPPAGIVNDDQLILVIIQGSGSTPAVATPPGGLTQVGTDSNVNAGGFFVRMAVYRKTAASESGSYSFTHPSHSTQGFILCYSGVSTTTPIDTTPTKNSGTGATATATGLTTVTANCMLLFLEHDFGDNATDQGPPTGMTERVDVMPLVYAADVVQASAGASGNKAHTCNSTGASPWAAFLVPLRPA